jgi:putative ABC transport system substrate-binding protein
MLTELGPKGLELLHAVVPAATRIAVLWHPGTPSAVPALKALEEPARLLALQVQPVGARIAGELEGAFATMARGRAQALVVLSTPPFITARQRLAELAIAHRLPTMFQGRVYVEAGGLMSYYPPLEDLWRHTAVYRRQDPQGRQTRRPARGAADQVRARHQPEDREGPGAHDSSVDPRASGFSR